MAWKSLYVFVEGNDDELFFDTVIRPLLRPHFNEVSTIKYGQQTDIWVNNFLSSIQSMSQLMEVDYLFLCDINNSPCVTAKKQEAVQRYTSLEESKIVVVVREVEGWYLAGLDQDSCKQLRIRCFADTNSITKEQFNQLMPSSIRARPVFLQQILQRFSLEVAKQKNASFQYLCRRLNL